MQEFCIGLSVCVRDHWFRRADEDYQVRCFAERSMPNCSPRGLVVS